MLLQKQQKRDAKLSFPPTNFQNWENAGVLTHQGSHFKENLTIGTIKMSTTSGEKGESLPCQFLKMEKSALILHKRHPFLQKGVLILEKKYPVCVHLWFTSSFKMQV